MAQLFSGVQGFLIDLDGVLYVGDQVIDGAVETINYLKNSGYPLRFATNTTTKSSATFYKKLKNLNLPIEPQEVISAPRVAVLHLRKMGNPSCFLCLNDDVKTDFAEFPVSESHPQVIVIGDIGDQWNYDIMNRMFRMAINGSDIIALHKGRYWQEPDGLRLDIGAFVFGLEYAAGTTATVIGKPNRAFFHMAVEDMGLAPENVVMIGDGIETDIGGAQAAGLKGILVKTGKYREELVARSAVTPDAVIQSIADLRLTPGTTPA